MHAMGQKSSEQPFVTYELVGTGSSFVQRFDASQSFDAFKSNVSTKLGLGGAARASDVIIKSVREGGKEVELDDQYDFEGLRARASALVAQGAGKSLLIRVHASGPTASPSRSPFSTTPTQASSSKKGKRRESDASTLPSGAPTPGTASTKKKRKKKRDSTVGVAPVMDGAQSPAPPTPSPASSKRPREASPPSTSAESSPTTKKRKILSSSSLLPTLPGHANLYKPHKPSPLGQQISREEEDAEDAAAAAARAVKRRRRKSKGASATPEESAVEVDSTPTAPVMPPVIDPTSAPVTDLAASSAAVGGTSKKRKSKSTLPGLSAPAAESNPIALASDSVKVKKVKAKSAAAPTSENNPMPPAPAALSAQLLPAATQITEAAKAPTKKTSKSSKAKAAVTETSPITPSNIEPSMSATATAVASAPTDKPVKAKKAKKVAAASTDTEIAALNAVPDASPATPATPPPARATIAKKSKKVSEKTLADAKSNSSPYMRQTAAEIMASYREKMRLEKEEKDRKADTGPGNVAEASAEAVITDSRSEEPAVSQPAESQSVAQAVLEEPAASSVDAASSPELPKEKKNRRKSKTATAGAPIVPEPQSEQLAEPELQADEAQAETTENSTANGLPSTPGDVSAKKASPPRPTTPLSVAKSAEKPAAQSVSAKKGRLSSSETARTALRDSPEDRVACSLCGEKPLHLQKECPVTLGGLESIEAALSQKRQLAQDRPNDMMLKKAIDALSTWQDRLARKERHPISDDAQEMPESAALPLQDETYKDTVASGTSAEGESTAADDELRGTSEVDVTPMATPAKTSSLATSPIRVLSVPPSPPSVIPAPIGRPYPARSVLLSKQGTPSKSSRSGISQSDVVFQTADEDSSSSGSTGNSAESESSSGSNSDEDSDDDMSDSEASDDAESDTADAPPTDDPEELMRHFFGAPLSQQLKKKARLSGISHDMARLPSKSPEDASGSEDEAAAADRSRRQESLSSVDVEEEEEEAVDEEDKTPAEVTTDIAESASPAFTRPAEVDAEAQKAGDASGVGEATTLSRGHSFAEMAMPSPTVAVDGDQAMEEAMAVDDEPDAWATIQTQPDMIHAQTSMSKGLPSPPSSASSNKEQSPAIEIALTQSHDDVEMKAVSPEKGPRWSISPQKKQQPLAIVADNEPEAQAENASVARRVTRSVSRDPAPLAGPSRTSRRTSRSDTQDPVSSTAPATNGRRLRSVSREIPNSLPVTPAQSRRSSSRVARGPVASQELPPAQPITQSIFKPTSKSKKAPSNEGPASQPLRRSSRRASTQEPIETSSQIDELASEPPSAAPNGEFRFPSPVLEDDNEVEEDFERRPAETQFTQVTSPAPRNPDHSLFLSLGSYPQQTQHYSAHPDVSSSIREDAPPSSPVPNGQQEKASSPVRVVDEEDDEEVYGSAAEHISPSASKRSIPRSPLSSLGNGNEEAKSDESEPSDDEEPVRSVNLLQTPRSYNSQPLPPKATGIFSSHIPTLSSLSSELLRMGRNAIGSPRTSVSASQPNTPSIFQAAEEDSSEDSDSSAEGAVPTALASRVAGAAKKPRRSMRESMGW